MTLFILTGVGLTMSAMCYAFGPSWHDADDADSDDEENVGKRAVALVGMMAGADDDDMANNMVNPLARGGT